MLRRATRKFWPEASSIADSGRDVSRSQGAARRGLQILHKLPHSDTLSVKAGSLASYPICGAVIGIRLSEHVFHTGRNTKLLPTRFHSVAAQVEVNGTLSKSPSKLPKDDKGKSVGGFAKVVGRISNAPRFVFKSDLLWYFKRCNLKATDFVFVYDTKYRPKFIQMQLDSMEAFRLAQKSLTLNGRIGGRFLKLTPEDSQLDDVNKILTPFHGRSLLLVKLPFGVLTEDIERFFSGYKLDVSYPIKIVRTVMDSSGGDRTDAAITEKTEFDMRGLVRFKTELEALRALREKQGSFLLDRPIDLRFIE